MFGPQDNVSTYQVTMCQNKIVSDMLRQIRLRPHINCIDDLEVKKWAQSCLSIEQIKELNLQFDIHGIEEVGLIVVDPRYYTKVQGTPLEPINWELPKIDDLDVRTSHVPRKTQKQIKMERRVDPNTTSQGTLSTTPSSTTPSIQETPTLLTNLIDLYGEPIV